MARISNWTPDRLPDLAGKTYVITGANSGIGLEAAKLLGAGGGNIVMACRSLEKAEAAQRELARDAKGEVSLVQLDLSDMASIRAAAENVRTAQSRIDALVNNAGIMQTPERKTADGFELQFGTNHLGHFLWTGLLIDRVAEAQGRVVQVSSFAHRSGDLHFDNLMLEGRYMPTRAYCQSKLANLVFALELDRRLQASGSPVRAMACHPGYSDTSLQSSGPTGLLKGLYKVTNAALAQPAAKGAWPTALAAADPDAEGGCYYGPTGMMEARGPVGTAKFHPKAGNEESGRRLWEESEKLLGFSFPIVPSHA